MQAPDLQRIRCKNHSMHFTELSESAFRFLRGEFSQRGEGCKIRGVAGFDNTLHEHVVQIFGKADVRHGLEE